MRSNCDEKIVACDHALNMNVETGYSYIQLFQKLPASKFIKLYLPYALKWPATSLFWKISLPPGLDIMLSIYMK